jgi:hypothetical protein
MRKMFQALDKWVVARAGAAEAQGEGMNVTVGMGLDVGSMIAFKLLRRQGTPPATVVAQEVGLCNWMLLHQPERISPRQAPEVHEHGRNSRLSR